MRTSLARVLIAFVLAFAIGAMSVLSKIADAAEPGYPAYPLKLSADKSYLIDQRNRPFFINGDTAWSLIVQLSQAGVNTYLSDRAHKGFNLVLVNLIDHYFATKAPANISGQQPFTTAGNFNTPNKAYFSYADWVIKQAAAKGIVVLLAPLYLGFSCGSEGWCDEVRRSSLATMRAYGRYLGKRYKDFPNIIWLIGGDTDPVANGIRDKVTAFVAGLKEYDKVHLITAHNGPEQAAMDVWKQEAWLNLNNVYTYYNSYSTALAQFNRTGRKPFFLMETYYENEHNSTPLSLRRQAYWTVLSGGNMGHVFGNCPIWYFNAPSGSKYCPRGPWKPQLDSAGSRTLALVGRLFRSRAFHKLVPDQKHNILTAGYGAESTYAAAARTKDGNTVIAYIPTQRNVTIDLTKLSGNSVKVWWFNPRNGSARLAGTFSNKSSKTFRPLDTGDWVLVIDNSASNFPAPGLVR